MFDFDKFINAVCVGDKQNEELKEGIFGRIATYIPGNPDIPSFDILVDFHKSYQKVEFETGNVPVTSFEIAAFIREEQMPEGYSIILQGDLLTVGKETFQIIDVRDDIDGLKKVILHYAPKDQD